MSPADLLAALDRLGTPRVLVLGDLILDRYTWGNAERVSQEAPVILLRADQREARLGGAANVCNMLRGLEAEVTCAGVLGDDADAGEVRRMLTEAGVDHSLLLPDANRPTTVKERFIGRAADRHPQQILRVDNEVRDLLSPALEERLAAAMLARLDEFQMVLVSDYDKGVCTPGLLAKLIAAAKRMNVPVLVDPIRGGDYGRYRGATSMTPNRYEAEHASGMKINTPEDAFGAGARLCRTLELDSAIVTLDRQGMALVPGVAAQSRGMTNEHFPTRPRDVYDITGAGDMVLAMLGAALAAGESLATAISLANVAGGLEVEKVGVVQVTRDEMRVDLLKSGREGQVKRLTLEQAARLAQAYRAKGARIVFTNGCFDLLHVGHVTYLGEAAAQGDVLFVGVNSDDSVRGLKGPGRPVINQHDRASLLAALECVDHVLVFDDPTPIELVRNIRPDVLVKGGDYLGRLHEIVGRELVESYGGKLYLTGVVEGVSTTRILKSVAA